MVASQLRVIYGDTDQMGVVYYANYLRFFEAGRTEFIRAKGLRYRDFEASYQLWLPVTEAHVRYLQPARYDDPIRIRCWVREAASRRVDFGYAVEHADEIDCLEVDELQPLRILDPAAEYEMKSAHG